jgi:hypothetical protein
VLDQVSRHGGKSILLVLCPARGKCSAVEVSRLLEAARSPFDAAPSPPSRKRQPAALSGFLRRSPSMPYSSALIRRCLPATLCGPVFSHQAAKRGASIFKMMDVMPLPTRSYISAVTLLLCTVGNVVLAQEGQTTTATASANNRGDACAQSIEKVINLCMMRGLNNIGPVKCDCVQNGPKWTCTGVASCVK